MRVVAAVSLVLVACAPQPAARPVQPEPVMLREVPLGIPEAPAGPEVIYLANAGVLLTLGDQAVLVDGLHRPYKPEYAVLDEATRGRVERAEGALATVRLVLVSHVHRDHFDVEAVRTYLSHNTGARLVSSPQVVEAVTAGLPADTEMLTRIEAVAYAPGSSQRRVVGGIEVEFIGLPHGSARFHDVHNLGHIVTFAGESFLHVGDTELDEPALAQLDLASRGLDVAFLPYWYFLADGGLEAVERRIGARRYFAVHVPPNDPQVAAALARAAPAVTPLVTPWSRGD